MKAKAILLKIAITTLITLTLHSSSTQDQVVTDGLVSCWTVDRITDQTAKDLWGNNNGILVGNPKVVLGRFGKALEFDGVDDYVDCGESESLNFDRKDAFSVEAWISPDREAGVHMIVDGKMLSFGTYRGWALWYRGVPKDQDGEQNAMALILRSQNATEIPGWV